MRMEFMCANCGKTIYPKVIGSEEAEKMSNGELFLRTYEDSMCFTIETCACKDETKTAIIRAVKATLANF